MIDNSNRNSNSNSKISAKSKKLRGNFGETYVCNYLSEQGYSVVCRNFRDKHNNTGEIDIIAENAECLAFVEVKTRKFNSLARGCSAVDLKKQVKIINTAILFMQTLSVEKGGRFDVAEVVITDSDNPDVVEMNYFKNAFTVSGKKGVISH
jgi:putative endonuclease